MVEEEEEEEKEKEESPFLIKLRDVNNPTLTKKV